jgi:hypothetical protein
VKLANGTEVRVIPFADEKGKTAEPFQGTVTDNANAELAGKPGEGWYIVRDREGTEHEALARITYPIG